MSADGPETEPIEIIGYRLVVNVAGPGFTDVIRVTAADLLELEPSLEERNGLIYERYGESDDFVEVRMDYVVARSVNPIEAQPEPAPGSQEVMGVTREFLDELDEQQRRS